MSNGLNKKLRDFGAFLLSDAVADDCMLLSELDGFLAGIVVCPDLIMPSEWMPLPWCLNIVKLKVSNISQFNTLHKKYSLCDIVDLSPFTL